MFTWIENGRKRKIAAQRLYDAAAAQSRLPEFYSRFGVADTFDGRFDLLCLHVALIMTSLSSFKSSDARKLSQAIFDRMFVKTDRTLREMGVGDLSVPRHMKKMMAAFNGRLRAYDAAMRSDDPKALRDALAHNLFRHDTSASMGGPGADAVADYIRDAQRAFAAISLSNFLEGDAAFPDVQEDRSNRVASHA